MTIYVEVDNEDNVIQFLIEDEMPTWGSNTFYEAFEITHWKKTTPTEKLKWNSGQPVWIETGELAELKLRKNAEINAARLVANRSVFTFQEKEIACDELSRSDIDAVNGIIAITNAMPPNWVGGWKAVDNTYVAIPDITTWINFYASMVQKGSSNFAHAQALKAQLASAETSEDITAIQWQT
jgi:hypothetical protein